METKKREEMMKRFNLYGEIYLLCLELVNGDSDMLSDFTLAIWETEEYGIECGYWIVTDDGEKMLLRDIEFIDGMLWIGRGGNESICFMDIKSESLQNVLNVLTQYKEVSA